MARTKKETTNIAVTKETHKTLSEDRDLLNTNSNIKYSFEDVILHYKKQCGAINNE